MGDGKEDSPAFFVKETVPFTMDSETQTEAASAVEASSVCAVVSGMDSETQTDATCEAETPGGVQEVFTMPDSEVQLEAASAVLDSGRKEEEECSRMYPVETMEAAFA